jgi:alanyl-tRNA synthetase
VVTDLSKELTCSSEELLPGVIKIKEELRSQKQSNAVLQGRLVPYITDSMLAAARDISGFKIVLHLFNNEEPELVKKIFNSLLERGSSAACLVNNYSGELQWHAGSSEDTGLPLKEIIPPLLPLIDGRGGGKGNRWQGIGRDIAGVQDFLKRVEQSILENKNKTLK